jgi:acetyl esterase/lipase
MLNRYVAPLVVACLAIGSFAQAAPLKTRDVLEIWPTGVAPGSENSPAKLTVTERSKVAYWPDRAITGITHPNLTAFVPDKPNGTAVIVGPGGAYARIAIDKESSEMARWLNPYGVTVFLMQYRLPAEGHANGKDAPLQDAQRAVRYVRAHAKEWNLDPKRIGFLGASAAGHMAASLDVQFAKKVYEPMDDADKLSARPDFTILLYPITSMETATTHMESRTNLIGKDPSPELIKEYSPDQNLTKDAPPTFVTLAEDDPVVPPVNGIGFCNGLNKIGASCELHTFKEGGHGFGIRDARQLPASTWPNLAADWMKKGGFIQ